MGERVISATGHPIAIASLVNASGVPRSGARVYAWIPDSSGSPTASPRTLYTTPDAATTAAANPYVLGTSGQGKLYKKADEGVVIQVKGASGADDAATTYLEVHFPAGIAGVDADWLDLFEADPFDTVRVKLTADTTIFVNHSTATTDINGNAWEAGSNSNTGLSRSVPLATITYAYKLIRDRYDCNGKKVVIQVCPRTFDEYVVCHGPCVGLQAETSGSGISPEGSMGIIIRGDLVDDDAAYNSRSDANPCWSFGYGARVRLEGFKYANTTCTDSLLKVSENSLVDLGQIIVGAAGGPGMQSANARIRGRASGDSSGWVKWDGNATIGLVIEVGNGQADFVDVRFGTTTFSGHPNSAWVNCGEGSYLGLYGCTFTSTFTGRKYYISDNANPLPLNILEDIPGSLQGVWTNPILTEPQGRLTLEDGVAVSTTDQTAKTTLYYEPYIGDYGMFSSNDEDQYEMVTIGTGGLSLALDSNNAHTGYHQSGKNFDVFFIRINETFYIATGPAWTNDTTRASAISRPNGILANTATMTARYGSASGDTHSCAAGEAVYIGTIRCTADGQTEDSVAKRMVWNAYNRVSRPILVAVGTDTWSGSGAASWRYFNADSANRAEFVVGLLEDDFAASATMEAQGSSSTIRPVRVGVGVNSNSAIATGCLPQIIASDNTAYKAATSPFRGLGQLGFNYVAPLEYDNASDTRTYRGDAGSATTCQTGLVGSVLT